MQVLLNLYVLQRAARLRDAECERKFKILALQYKQCIWRMFQFQSSKHKCYGIIKVIGCCCFFLYTTFQRWTVTALICCT